MKKSLVSLCLIAGMLFCGCQIPPDEEDPHLLAGTWGLTTLSVETIAISNVDTVAITPSGIDLPIVSGILLFNGAIDYTTADGIQGQVVLEDDGAASLAGTLPVNVGTDCNPLIILSSVASDGTWEADITTGDFELNLDFDQLDIQGQFAYDETSQSIEISYTFDEPMDTLLIQSVLVDNEPRVINGLCLPVATEITRTLSFNKE